MFMQRYNVSAAMRHPIDGITPDPGRADHKKRARHGKITYNCNVIERRYCEARAVRVTKSAAIRPVASMALLKSA
jgi:hypothetical protein